MSLLLLFNPHRSNFVGDWREVEDSQKLQPLPLHAIIEKPELAVTPLAQRVQVQRRVRIEDDEEELMQALAFLLFDD